MSLRKDMIWNLFGGILPLISAFISIPLLLEILGKDKYGLLTLIWATIGYFSILDLGISRSLTVKVSEILKSRSSVSELATTIQAGLTLVTILGIFFGILSFFVLSYCIQFIKIDILLFAEAKSTMIVISIGVLATVINSAIRGVMEGLLLFKLSNIYRSLLGVGYFLIPLISVQFHDNSLYMIAIYLVLFRIICSATGLLHLRMYIYRSHISSLLKVGVQLLSYGAWVTLSNLISPLMVYGDRFLISALVGVTVLSVYTIPQEGLQRLLILPAALCGALLPRFAGGNMIDHVELYKESYKKLIYVSLTASILASLLAYPFLLIWISKTFAKDSFWIVQLFCIGIFANSCAQVPYTFLMARNSPKTIALIHSIELVLYFCIVPVVVKHWGVEGAAVCWSLRAVVDWIILDVVARKLIKKNKSIYKGAVLC